MTIKHLSHRRLVQRLSHVMEGVGMSRFVVQGLSHVCQGVTGFRVVLHRMSHVMERVGYGFVVRCAVQAVVNRGRLAVIPGGMPICWQYIITL